MKLHPPAALAALRRSAYAVVLVALAACSEQAIAPPGDPALAAGVQQQRQEIAENEFPAVRRTDVELRATGSFRPGAPITVDAVLKGNRGSASTRLELLVLDDDEADRPGASKRVGDWTGPVAASAQARVPAQVRFSRPGYYRVLARAVSTPPAGEREPGAGAGLAVLDESFEMLWMVIDEAGGRLTDGYDPAVAKARPLLYGAYGPFSGPAQPRESRRRGGGQETGGGLVIQSFPGQYTGTFRYRDLSVFGSPLVGIPNALIVGWCRDADYQWTYSTSAYTDASGNFTVSCFSDATGMWADATLQNSDTHVKGKNGASTSVYFDSYANSGTFDLRVSNDYAGRVFDDLSVHIPIAESWFSDSRVSLTAWVNPTDTAGGINYSPANDRLHTNYTRIFTSDGTFVTVHEYGHAFQYGALEQWQSYYCSSDGSHSVNVAYTLSCAYVEGFADFFAVWVAGAKLGTGTFTDNNFEGGPYRSVGDGSLVEGAVGAFLYDMVDGTGSPDGISGDDDSVTWPGSYISQLMATCGFTGVTKLDGIDQFIYCAENSVAASSGNPYASWRSYASFSESATEPSGWAASTVRSLWRYNLYNLGSLP